MGFKTTFSLCSFPFVSAAFSTPKCPVGTGGAQWPSLLCHDYSLSISPSSSCLERDLPFLELQLVRSETLSMPGDCRKLWMDENPAWSDASRAAGAADRWHLLPGRTVSLSSCSLLCLMHGLSSICTPLSIPGVMAT